MKSALCRIFGVRAPRPLLRPPRLSAPGPRRAFFALLVAALTVAGSAFAGSYLNRVALLVSGARQDTSYLRAHLHDRELSDVVRRVALARVAAAGSMEIPKEVQLAHPHALLVLEAHAQAADAASQGDAQRFIILAQRAADEERTLEAVLKQLGWSLPKR